MSDVVVISGLSGAGRTQAGNWLEDLGWFVIDNLPPVLIPKVAELAISPRSQTSKVALIVGPAAGHEELADALAELRGSGSTVRVVFLDAAGEVLVRRYESSKRPHPASEPGDGLVDAIEREREQLRSIKESADLVIDTSTMSIYDLRNKVRELVGAELADSMVTTVQSFGYKHGIPSDVDLVIDCRFLPNPFWVEGLRELTGKDEAVRDYLFDIPMTGKFLDRLGALLELLVPAYREEGKAYLTIALGCTGGRHRSVAMVEAVGAILESQGVTARRVHRDIGK